MTILVTTTAPALGRFEYSLQQDGRWLHEGVRAAYAAADLTGPQQAVLAAGQAVLQDLAEADALERDLVEPGTTVVVQVSKPQAAQVEYALVPAGGPVRHGLVVAYDPGALGAGPLADLLAARALLQELATADAVARGLLPAAD